MPDLIVTCHTLYLKLAAISTSQLKLLPLVIDHAVSEDGLFLSGYCLHVRGVRIYFKVEFLNETYFVHIKAMYGNLQKYLNTENRKKKVNIYSNKQNFSPIN